MFIEPEHSLIDPGAANHGVLSLIFSHQPQDRPPADSPALDQADHHSHVLDNHRVGPDHRRFARRSFAPGSLTPVPRLLRTSALIKGRLLSLTLSSTAIGGTALCGSPLAVCYPAAEGTPQIAPPSVTRMGKKENATMPAPGQAGTQKRLGSQHRSQQPVILQDQGGYRALTIPVGLEVEMLCDLGCKKTKLALKMLR
jgi:hypothetical protein